VEHHRFGEVAGCNYGALQDSDGAAGNGKREVGNGGDTQSNEKNMDRRKAARGKEKETDWDKLNLPVTQLVSMQADEARKQMFAGLGFLGKGAFFGRGNDTIFGD